MRNHGHLFFAGTLLLALAVASPAHAQEGNDPIPARVRYFEGTVTVQRAHAAETSPALINLPVDAGDRLWTDGQGRVELTFGDGTTVWFDHLTTVDVVSLPRAGAGDTIIRLWGGSLIVERPAAYDRQAQVLRVDTADAAIVLPAQGSYRVDLDDEHRAWLSVYDGNATMSARGLTEIVAAGESTYAEPGTAPAEVVDFNTAEHDSFSNWQIERWMALAETQSHVRDREYVPEEARPYAADLESHGRWVYYDDFSSYAWRPSVAIGWAPFRNGRWVYSYAGWTWVPYASWGWATAHYGRWHHTPAYGWMWFPGSVYSPGWVSWYAGSGYLGWSPLGYYNRPFPSIGLFFGGHYGYGSGYHGGRNYDYAVRRGGKAVAGLGYARDGDAEHGWTFVDADHFGTGKSELRATSRSAVPRQATGSAVSFQGNLRPRKPSALASVGTPRGSGVRTTVSRPGAPEGIRAATPRGSTSTPRTPTRSGLATGRGTSKYAPQAPSRSAGSARVRPSSPRDAQGASVAKRPSARPRNQTPSRPSSRPRATSSGTSRSRSSSDSGASALSRGSNLPTRARLGGSPTTGGDPERAISRTPISRYAPQTSRFQSQSRSYRPRGGSSQPSRPSTAAPQNRYTPASPRYAPSRTSPSPWTRSAPSIQPRSAIGSRSSSTLSRSFSPPSRSVPRSFSAPRGSAMGGRSSGRSVRSFSAPSRGMSGRSSGRSAIRRSGKR